MDLRLSILLEALIVQVMVLWGQVLAVEPAQDADLRKQFLDTFAKVESGQEVSKIALPKGWLDKALIQEIQYQTGKWNVEIEDGTTIFRIYPYHDEKEGEKLGGYSCVVVKVNDSFVTVGRLIEAFGGPRRGETSNLTQYSVGQSIDPSEGRRSEPLRITEHSVDYPDGRSVHKTGVRGMQRPLLVLLLILAAGISLFIGYHVYAVPRDPRDRQFLIRGVLLMWFVISSFAVAYVYSPGNWYNRVGLLFVMGGAVISMAMRMLRRRIKESPSFLK